eukprot:GHVN01071523.1.p1 GENE.GHVN01071523.1~~GHVN01071523.1.p1  ORF type:complete len:259 (+),score=75.76 GHVN01071523.1:259-1035(+)
MDVIDALDVIPPDIDPKDKSEGLSLIIKLLSNAIAEPHNEKYRSVKQSNKTIRQRLMLDHPTHSLRGVMMAAGFRDENGVFTLSSPLPVDVLRGHVDLLSGVVASLQVLIPPTPAPPPLANSPPLTAVADTTHPFTGSTASLEPSAPPLPPTETNPLPLLRSRNPELGAQQRKAEEQLQAIRDERARQFAEVSHSAPPSQSSSTSNSCPQRGERSNQDRGFFSTLFGGTSRNTPSSTSRGQSSRTMTIRDLPQQPKKG